MILQIPVFYFNVLLCAGQGPAAKW